MSSAKNRIHDFKYGFRCYAISQSLQKGLTQQMMIFIRHLNIGMFVETKMCMYT